MWLEVVSLGVQIVLVAILALDIVESRRRKINERLQRVEEFLRFSVRKP